jgi:hypothetical protein
MHRLHHKNLIGPFQIQLRAEIGSISPAISDIKPSAAILVPGILFGEIAYGGG